MKHIIPCLFLCWFLQNTLQAQMKLPTKRPIDFSLSSKYSGGMSYHFSDLYISKDSCVYIEDKNGKKSTQYFKLSKKELNALYASLLKNTFDQIQVENTRESIYDRGGTIITVTWDNRQKIIIIDNTASNFVKKEWQNAWNVCQAELKKIIESNIKTDKK